MAVTCSAPWRSTLRELLRTPPRLWPKESIPSGPGTAEAGITYCWEARGTRAPGAGLPKVAGTVPFTDGAASLGSAAVDATGSATLTVKLAPGNHSLTAAYSGDVNDSASASAPLAYSVVLATTKVVLATSGTPAQA